MGALDGIRVVDFGQWIAGPLAAMLLADHGADVVRVDPPGGPRWRTPANATWNRGKRHVVLDLARERDRAAARRLIAGADVVVENFRPGVMARLGLGPAEATRDDPRLIYCSLPGFAAADPRAAMPAWEGVVAAATGGYGDPGAPRFTAVPVASCFAALAGAVAVVMALIARERDGLGQRIEVPLFHAGPVGGRPRAQRHAGPREWRSRDHDRSAGAPVGNPGRAGAPGRATRARRGRDPRARRDRAPAR